jgi:hypothetical protein
VIGLLANLASCSSTPASGVSSASLAGKTVVSTSVTGHTLAAGSTVTLTFEGPIPGGLRRLQHDERGLCSRQFRIAHLRWPHKTSVAGFLQTGAAALLTGKQLSLTSNSITMKLAAK